MPLSWARFNLTTLREEGLQSPPERQTLALAGIFQAAGLVRELARQGTITYETAKEASLRSIFVLAPDSVKEVYGGLSGVRLGLTLLRNQLNEPPLTDEPKGSKEIRDPDLTRYVIGLTTLERKLVTDPSAWKAFGSGLEEVRSEFEALDPTDPSLIAQLATLYVEHITPLGTRIVIRGEEAFLNDTEKVAQIRALLLAGLRSAVLWRQEGGRRWQLLVWRKRFLDNAKQLLARAPLS